MDDLFKSLDIDKGEWLEDIERGKSSLASILACIASFLACISERESKRFEEELNTKVKLYIYKRFGKSAGHRNGGSSAGVASLSGEGLCSLLRQCMLQ